VLEFVGIIINVWIVLGLIRTDKEKLGGHVLSIQADNTSALSWLRHAARAGQPAIRNLAYLCQCLLLSHRHPTTQPSWDHTYRGRTMGKPTPCHVRNPTPHWAPLSQLTPVYRLVMFSSSLPVSYPRLPGQYRLPRSGTDSPTKRRIS
jgi:hypothetical protein